MATNDILQFKRKLVKPQIRAWGVDKKTGETFIVKFPGTKKNLVQAIQPKDKIKKLIKKNLGNEFEEKFFVAYKGKEYTAHEFAKKYPKYFK